MAAADRVTALGILKGNFKAYSKIIPDSATSMPVIADKTIPDSIVYTNGHRNYNVLDVNDFYHE